MTANVRVSDVDIGKIIVDEDEPTSPLSYWIVCEDGLSEIVVRLVKVRNVDVLWKDNSAL